MEKTQKEVAQLLSDRCFKIRDQAKADFDNVYEFFLLNRIMLSLDALFINGCDYHDCVGFSILEKIEKEISEIESLPTMKPVEHLHRAFINPGPHYY